MTTAPLRCIHTVFLHIQDGLLAKEDEKLPLAGHVVGTLQHLHFVKNFITIVFVWAQKVIVGNLGPVQPFHDLFERTVFFRHSIVVGKSNHLGDLERKVFARLFCEFHGSKWCL